MPTSKSACSTGAIRRPAHNKDYLKTMKMKYDPAKHHRRSIRLQDYDYSQDGAYGITICTANRELFFENPPIATIAEQCWLAIPQHFSNIELDEWILMPNHLHGIILITNDNGRGVQLNALPLRDSNKIQSTISPHSGTLAVVVRTFKGAVTTQCRTQGYAEFAWQRLFYDRIIRDEPHLSRVRQYIIDNPGKWIEDQYNPQNG